MLDALAANPLAAYFEAEAPFNRDVADAVSYGTGGTIVQGNGKMRHVDTRGKVLAAIAEKVVIKVPLAREGITAGARLVEAGHVHEAPGPPRGLEVKHVPGPRPQLARPSRTRYGAVSRGGAPVSSGHGYCDFFFFDWKSR